jgi:hypothetical protein
MKAKKQQEQKNDATGQAGSVTPDKTAEPQPEATTDKPKPPPEKETDKHIIAPDGAPEVKQEPEPLF